MDRPEVFNTIDTLQWNVYDNQAFVSNAGSDTGLFHRHVNDSSVNDVTHPPSDESDGIINNCTNNNGIICTGNGGGSNSSSSSDLLQRMTDEAREAARSPLTIPMVAAFSLLAFGGLIFAGIIFGVTKGITKTAQQADDLREFASQLFDAFFTVQVSGEASSRRRTWLPVDG